MGQPPPHPPGQDPVGGLLGKLGQSTKREVPIILQTSAADCGAASVAMALGYHGREVTLDDVRKTMAVDRDGVSARGIVEAAALFDLMGRGVRIEPDDFIHLETGSILHWRFQHFVVFDKLVGNEVVIVDPAMGRRSVSREEVSRSFTGIAIVFERTQRFTPMKGGPKPVYRYLRQIVDSTDIWGRIAVSSLLLQFFSIGLPLINGRLIDRVVPRQDYGLLAILLVGLLGISIFYFLAAMVRAQLLLNLRTHFEARMTTTFVDHLLKLPYAFFQRRLPADLLLRVNSTQTIREVLTGTVLSGVIDGILVCSYLLVLLVLSLRVALIALVIVGVQASIFWFTRKRMLELSNGVIAKQAETANSLNEALHGVETLKAAGCEHRALQQWSTLYVDLINITLRRGVLSSWSESALNTVRMMGPFVLLVVGIFQVMDGSMSLGTMLSANAFAAGFIQPMMNLISTATQLQNIRGHVDRFDDVLSTAPEQERREAAVAPRLRGDIQLRNVSFQYSPKAPFVVREVSVDVRAGQCVAIVGRSGSGKTTLASLMLGLYQPIEGTVAYDGINLGAVQLKSVRRQLGVVLQKPYIFGTTIRANIALADPAMDFERIRRAGRLACIDDDVSQMPMGYDTVVVQSGSSLSGGQRQRIALARALVESPSILLLDEATSALDAATEAQVQANLDQLGCTRIVIAHRLSTVINADLILVVEKGRIVESGRHGDLVRRGGLYAELVATQLGRGEIAAQMAAPAARPSSGRLPAAPPSAPHPASQEEHTVFFVQTGNRSSANMIAAPNAVSNRLSNQPSPPHADYMPTERLPKLPPEASGEPSGPDSDPPERTLFIPNKK